MIEYVVGDATAPVGEGRKIIIHCCNNLGGWGRGFVLALSAKWKEPEKSYRAWSKTKDFGIGKIQLVPVGNDITVANMVGQDGMYPRNGVPPIRYEALESCLKQLNDIIGSEYTIHAPRIGCGLAGGSWDKVEDIINRTLTNKVYVYDLKETK